MTTKHTPGPWIIGGEEIDRSITIRSETYDDIATVHIPASANSMGGWTKLPQQLEANAHLIAAAPDLLAALENLDNAINEPSLGIDLVEASNQARAAIAKARGEAKNGGAE